VEPGELFGSPDVIALIESWRPVPAEAADSTPKPVLEVDGEAGAWYVRLLDEDVARTTEQPGPVNVDWTRDGRMVGVELLAAETSAQVEFDVGGKTYVGKAIPPREGENAPSWTTVDTGGPLGIFLVPNCDLRPASAANETPGSPA
jgi:hypothetical protein